MMDPRTMRTGIALLLCLGLVTACSRPASEQPSVHVVQASTPAPPLPATPTPVPPSSHAQPGQAPPANEQGLGHKTAGIAAFQAGKYLHAYDQLTKARAAGVADAELLKYLALAAERVRAMAVAPSAYAEALAANPGDPELVEGRKRMGFGSYLLLEADFDEDGIPDQIVGRSDAVHVHSPGQKLSSFVTDVNSEDLLEVSLLDLGYKSQVVRVDSVRQDRTQVHLSVRAPGVKQLRTLLWARPPFGVHVQGEEVSLFLAGKYGRPELALAFQGDLLQVSAVRNYPQTPEGVAEVVAYADALGLEQMINRSFAVGDFPGMPPQLPSSGDVKVEPAVINGDQASVVVVLVDRKTRAETKVAVTLGKVGGEWKVRSASVAAK